MFVNALRTMGRATTASSTSPALNPFHNGSRTIGSVFQLQQTAGMKTASALKVKDVLKRKERSRWTVEDSSTVFEATKKMVEENVGSLVVIRKGQVVGIVTERDYLRKVVHQGRSSANTTVGQIATMQDKLIVASLEDSIQDCVDAMGARDIRHMPVADPSTGEFIGLLSIREVAKALAKEREAAFRKLEDVQVSSQMPIHDG